MAPHSLTVNSIAIHDDTVYYSCQFFQSNNQSIIDARQFVVVHF